MDGSKEQHNFIESTKMDQNKVMPKAPKTYLAQCCSTVAIERELVQWYDCWKRGPNL